jgi:putative aminopeptidase FrvX
MNAAQQQMLQAILSRPTAPFRERWVQAEIERIANDLNLIVRRDTYGNLYLGYRNGHGAPLAFTAHMDHPGFDVVEGGTRARGFFLGGVAAENMLGAAVRCFGPDAAGASAPPAGVRGRIAGVGARVVHA